MNKKKDRQLKEKKGLPNIKTFQTFLNVIKSQCPFIEEPSEECYCVNMDSRKIESAIFYCGENFHSCEIYKNNMTDGKEAE